MYPQSGATSGVTSHGRRNPESDTQAANQSGGHSGLPPQQLLDTPRERRRRTKWAPAEVTALLKGVEKHGVSKWADILADPELQFASSRKPVDLKDKWRVMTTRRKPVPNLPTAADVTSWSPLMTTGHQAQPRSARPSEGQSLTLSPTQRKRPWEDAHSNSNSGPVAIAVNRGSTPPPDSGLSLFDQALGSTVWQGPPYSSGTPGSGHTDQPPPAPPPVAQPVAHALHPLVLDLLPPDLMFDSMWEREAAPKVKGPVDSDTATEDVGPLTSLVAPSSLATGSTTSVSQYLPPSPSATPVASPSPAPSASGLIHTDSDASGRGRPLIRVHPDPNKADLEPPDAFRDFFNSRYHPRVEYRIPPPPKAMLEWENVMRVRSVSPESRNRFAGVPRSPGGKRSSPAPSSTASPLVPNPSSSTAEPDTDQSGFDMSEMLQAVMCLDSSTRSQVFHILTSREFANSPHKQAVAAKFALRPQDMVPVDSPREQADKAMSVDGEEGCLTREMKAVLESGNREVLRFAKGVLHEPPT